MTQTPNTRVRARRFGHTDLQVSSIGLGCARIGGIFKRDPRDFVDLLSAAFDGGINVFDTADIYSQGESEKLLGQAFRGRRDRIVVASKAGYVLPSQRRLAARMKPLVRPMIKLLGISRQHLPSVVRGQLAQNFSPAHLERAIDGSLRRIGTDYLDLFQLHSPPVDVVARGEWLHALESLKRKGKLRYYGVSCETTEAADAALDHATVSALQLPINLLEREALRVLPRAEAQGVGVIARECLANGLLVKNVSLQDIRTYCQSDEEAADKERRLTRYREAAALRGCSLQQLALQYVTQLQGVSVTLVGVSRREQLDALLRDGLATAHDSDRSDIPHFA